MTKRELEQLRSLKKEAEHLQEELKHLPTTKDCVSGSMTVFPYIKKSIVIEGIDADAGGELKKKLTKKRRQLQRRIEEMEDWLDSVDDSELRDILRLKYRMGQSDYQIGEELGYDRSTISGRIREFFK